MARDAIGETLTVFAEGIVQCFRVPVGGFNHPLLAPCPTHAKQSLEEEEEEERTSRDSLDAEMEKTSTTTTTKQKTKTECTCMLAEPGANIVFFLVM